MVEEVTADRPMEHAKKGNTRLIHRVGDQDGHGEVSACTYKVSILHGFVHEHNIGIIKQLLSVIDPPKTLNFTTM